MPTMFPLGVDRVLAADEIVRTLPETTATLLNAGFRGQAIGVEELHALGRG